MLVFIIKTIAGTEIVEASQIDESDALVVRFTLANGQARTYSRAALISFEQTGANATLTDEQRDLVTLYRNMAPPKPTVEEGPAA